MHLPLALASPHPFQRSPVSWVCLVRRKTDRSDSKLLVFSPSSFRLGANLTWRAMNYLRLSTPFVQSIHPPTKNRNLEKNFSGWVCKMHHFSRTFPSVLLPAKRRKRKGKQQGIAFWFLVEEFFLRWNAISFFFPTRFPGTCENRVVALFCFVLFQPQESKKKGMVCDAFLWFST